MPSTNERRFFTLDCIPMHHQFMLCNKQVFCAARNNNAATCRGDEANVLREGKNTLINSHITFRMLAQRRRI